MAERNLGGYQAILSVVVLDVLVLIQYFCGQSSIQSRQC